MVFQYLSLSLWSNLTILRKNSIKQKTANERMLFKKIGLQTLAAEISIMYDSAEEFRK